MQMVEGICAHDLLTRSTNMQISKFEQKELIVHGNHEDKKIKNLRRWQNERKHDGQCRELFFVLKSTFTVEMGSSKKS